MNVQEELPSDSDDSDVDFIPEGEESGLSEEDSDGDVEEEDTENKSQQKNSKRRKNHSERKKKKMKRNAESKENGDEKEEEIIEEQKPVLSAEEEKKRVDSLWADFMKDCKAPPKKENVTPTNGATTNVSLNSTKKDDKELQENEVVKTTVKEVFEFAGEKIEVEKECTSQSALPNTDVRGRGTVGPGRGRGRGVGGIASLLGQIGKKNKLSTLEKSKLDWDMFKKEEGIADDLHAHNKGKDGYLEKQDFLERADLRQFEIEKQLRTSRKSNR